MARKSSNQILHHGVRRFSANTSDFITSGASTGPPPPQVSGAASLPPDLFSPEAFAGGSVPDPPSPFGKIPGPVKDLSSGNLSTQPANLISLFQSEMFNLKMVLGTYQSFRPFFHHALWTWCALRRQPPTGSHRMCCFGDRPIQALSQSGQLTNSFEMRMHQLTGIQGSGTGFGLCFLLKKLNVLFGL